MAKSAAKPLVLLAGLLSWLGLAETASTYCIAPIFAPFWAQLEANDEIPVYISVGPHTSVEHTGRSLDEIERLTRELIARHNEATTGPILVYEGLVDKDMDYGFDGDVIDEGLSPFDMIFGPRDQGVTIDSYSCEWKDEFQPCGDDPKTRGCARTAQTKPKARVTLVPIGCGDAKPPHDLSSHDLATVMLHELGHALGLQHNQSSKATCEQTATHVHGNAPEGNDGVMRATLGANFPANREWRRDDLDGLSALYGPPPAMELAYWEDDIFPEAPAQSDLTSFVDASFRRPPAVTSATLGAGLEQFLATTDADARVIVYAFSPAGLSPPEIIDPSPAGRTWANPGVALGDHELFVVWPANERPEDDAINLRWALRALASDEWTIVEDTQTTRVKRVAAGYAPNVELFIVTSLADFSGHPLILVIDPQGELLATHEIVDITAFDIGGPACFLDGAIARCVVPYSTNSFAGPKLGWLDVEFDEFGEPWILDDTAGYVDARGKLGLASRPDLASFRGSAGARRYDLGQLAGLGAVDLPSPAPPPDFDAHAWPIACGSAHAHRDAPHWWSFTRRRVACGDGLVQALEQCDDANLEPGDGCSPACELEVDEPGPDFAPAATETGADAGLVDNDEDCECRARPRGSATPALVLLVLLAALRPGQRRFS